MASKKSKSKAREPRWMALATAEMGTVAHGPGSSNPRIEEYHRTVTERPWDDKVPWCSSFLNWCIRGCGLAGTDSGMARSWLKWGTPLKQPCRGCIVVLWREEANSEKGHVGFYLHEKDGHVHLLGGNQLGAVRQHSYPTHMILGFRWPPGEAEPAG